MKKILGFSLCLCCIFLYACDDDDSSGPAKSNCETGSNPANEMRFDLDGGEFSDFTVNWTNNQDPFSVKTSIFILGKTVFATDGVFDIGGGETRSIGFTITFPGESPGSFSWENGQNNESANGLTLQVVQGTDTTVYYPVEGNIAVSTYTLDDDDIVDVVAGAFCGTVRCPDGSSITVSNGRFINDF